MVFLQELTFSQLLKSISSRNPAPGGGSVSGWLLALAAALTAKVCAVSKKQDFLPEEFEHSQKVMAKGLELANEDTEKYLKLVESYKSKRNPEEANIQAAITPINISQEALVFMDTTMQVLVQGNPNARTDALISLLILKITLMGGILNAEINLRSLSDSETKNDIIKTLKELLKNYELKEQEINQLLKSHLLPLDSY